MYRRTGIDNGLLVVGILLCILSICLFATVGAMLKLEYIVGYANSIQFAVGAWYLLTAILGIAAGVTGHKCPYVGAIVISILAILASLGGIAVAAVVAFTQAFVTTSRTIYNSGYFTTDASYSNYFGYSETSEGEVSPLVFGPVVINGISFIMLIVLSALSCCGGCCNNSRAPSQGGAMYVTTTGGYTPATAPPGYVNQPPQQYNFQGAGNPNYDQNIAMQTK